MTPHKHSRKVTERIDRMFAGVGRIARAYGTSKPALRRKINRMLTALEDEGRLDLLRALRDRKLTPLQLYDAYQRHTLHQLPTADAAKPLALAWLRWTLDKECSLEHKRSLVQSLRHLLNADVASPFGDAKLEEVAKGLPRKTIADLPDCVTATRKRLAAHPRSFNLARSAAQAFLRETFKRSHPLWRDVTDVEPLVAKAQRLKRPQTAAGLVDLCKTVDADVEAAIWSMATTGMGPKEYWGGWEHRPHGIHIYGTKREGRDRDIPDLGYCSRPQLSRQAFEDRLVEQTGAAITPYDLRRSFSNWLEAAGIIRARRRMYMGHGPKDSTDLYEWHEVVQFLAADTERLKTWLATELKAVESGPRLVVELDD